MKIAQGNPGGRPLNLLEPQPTGIPQCPTYLNEVAKREWHRIAPELISLGLLTKVDRAALAAYCVSYSRWVAAEQSVDKYGAVIKVKGSDTPLRNPHINVANLALDQMRKLLVEFGMTPASRSRIQVTPTATDDPFTEFMSELCHGEPLPELETQTPNLQ
jgi:P27 family predicted phage terminase small subunit